MPSTAARARLAGVALARVSPASRPRASGRFGVRSPSRYGSSVSPPAPGSAGQRQLVQLGQVDAEQARRPRSAPGPRSACRPAAGAGRSRRRTRPPSRSASAAGTSLTPNAVPEVPSDTTTSPGAEAEPERGGHVVAGARRRAAHPPAVSPDRLGRPGDPRQLAASRPNASAQQVRPVLPGGRRPVAGAGGVAAVGGRRLSRTGPQPVREPVVRQQTPSRPARRCAGSARASQRSFVTVKLATGTEPTASAQRRGPPSSATRSAAARRGRVSFHSSAGRTTSPVVVQAHHAVLLAADADRGDAVEQPAGGRLRERVPTTAAGSTSVASGCAARPSRTTAPVSASHTTTFVDWVDESTPATSVIDRTPSRCSIASWSSRSNAMPRAASASTSNVLGPQVGERLAGARGSARAARGRGPPASASATSGSARNAAALSLRIR